MTTEFNPAFVLALSQTYVEELPTNEKNHPMILYYFANIGHKWVQNDEYAWCAAAMNSWLKDSGYESFSKLNAKHFLKLPSIPDDPVMGKDIAIFHRQIEKYGRGPDNPYGHVAWYVCEDETKIIVLGGNQYNKVCVRDYPKENLVGYRRPQRIS